MVRKVFIFLLLIAGWGVIFYPLVANPTVLQLPFGAHPAGSLPQAWKNGAEVQVAPRSTGGDTVVAENAGGSDSAAICAPQYTIQAGESLGRVARQCAITLESLLAVNPQITNPNRVNAGQLLTIPIMAGRGGGDDLAQAVTLAGRYAPGAVIDIHATGLPPGVAVRVGIGLSSSGYRIIQQAVSGLDGSLTLAIRIPQSAQSGERAFILVTASGVPAVQVISTEFLIE
jgi:LysM repeat protein